MTDKYLCKEHNCYTCAHCSLGGTMDWSDYCKIQGYHSIEDKDARCPYYRRSIWDIIVCLLDFSKDLRPHSANITGINKH